MTKGIYLNKANEALITEYADKENVSISKAINLLIERNLSKVPTKVTKDESKPPKEVKQTDKLKKKESPLERPLSRSELFRNISNNRA